MIYKVPLREREYIKNYNARGEGHRSETEIIYSLMLATYKTSDRGIKKTHLMYVTNLNSKMLSKYLERLVQLNIVKYVLHGNEKRVVLTKRGIALLFILEKMYELIEERDKDNLYKNIRDQVEYYAKSNGLSIVREYYVKGKLTGLPHIFDLALGPLDPESKELIVARIVTDQSEATHPLLIFIMSLIDTGLRGIFISVPSLKHMMSFAEIFSDRCEVVDGVMHDNIIEKMHKAVEKMKNTQQIK